MDPVLARFQEIATDEMFLFRDEDTGMWMVTTVWDEDMPPPPVVVGGAGRTIVEALADACANWETAYGELDEH